MQSRLGYYMETLTLHSFSCRSREYRTQAAFLKFWDIVLGTSKASKNSWCVMVGCTEMIIQTLLSVKPGHSLRESTYLPSHPTWYPEGNSDKVGRVSDSET